MGDTSTENKQQSSELNLFGFVTAKLRRGLVTGVIAVLIVAVCVLWWRLGQMQEKQEEQFKDHLEDLRSISRLESRKVVQEDVVPKVDSMRQKVDTLAEEAKGAIKIIKDKSQ